jgi:ABC-type multidrug transport system ATPase subunit
LLVVDLPGLEDPGFATWARDRIAQLRSRGMAIVQSVRAPSELLSAATRAMWLRDGRLWAFGHAESVFEADRRERLGLEPAAEPRPTALSTTGAAR